MHIIRISLYKNKNTPVEHTYRLHGNQIETNTEYYK